MIGSYLENLAKPTIWLSQFAYEQIMYALWQICTDLVLLEWMWYSIIRYIIFILISSVVQE